MSELVKRVEVARFLGMALEEVTRLIEQDKLPHARVPGPTRPGFRIFLPDLHAWLCRRSEGSPRLADYAEFRRAFFAAQAGRRGAVKG